MNEALQQELTGRPPVLVSLGGQDYPLAFPIHAVILYKRATGDNLFDGTCWSKIAPLEDPERFVACLWAGLHQSADDVWSAPFTVAQLGRLIDFSNVTPVCEAISKALSSYFPAVDKKEAGKEPAAAGEEPLPAPEAAASSEAASASVSAPSGPLPVLTSA